MNSQAPSDASRRANRAVRRWGLSMTRQRLGEEGYGPTGPGVSAGGAAGQDVHPTVWTPRRRQAGFPRVLRPLRPGPRAVALAAVHLMRAAGLVVDLPGWSRLSSRRRRPGATGTARRPAGPTNDPKRRLHMSAHAPPTRVSGVEKVSAIGAQTDRAASVGMQIVETMDDMRPAGRSRIGRSASGVDAIRAATSSIHRQQGIRSKRMPR